MRILATADDSGSLKEIKCSRGTDTSSQSALQPEKIETFVSQDLNSRIQKLLITQDDPLIVAARANGEISIYKPNTYELVTSISKCFIGGARDEFVSLFESKRHVYAVSEQGRITIISITDNFEYSSVDITAPISSFVAHPTQQNIFAYGGKENDLKIIRMSKGSVKILFQAKNVKNDKLDLRVPIWITNIAFIDIESHTESSWALITTTRYGQIRKYLTSHGRKPVFDKKISEAPLYTLALTANDDEVICSDSRVTTALFNIEKGTLVAKYKGAVGSVRSIHVSKGLLVTGALDRYVRVFDITTREQVAKVFIGTKISAVQLIDDRDEPKEQEQLTDKYQDKRKKHTRKHDDKDANEVWEQLEKLEGPVKKKKV